VPSGPPPPRGVADVAARRSPVRRPRRRIDLALQGGGAHGAFTWGVLDRLLEDERIEIDALSGASAGAMNAVVLAAGLLDGGRAGAREALRRFWSRVGRLAGAGNALSALFGDWSLAGPPLAWYAEWMPRMLSPYQFNPFDLNPLRDILVDEVDFARLRGEAGPQLFVSATHVRSGRLREFRRSELSAEAVLASACLPMLYRAVEVDGEAYWDGGYVGNPSLLPLIAESPAHDLVLVQINPSCSDAVPTTSSEILDRINEITFNSSLVKELRTVALLKRLLGAGDAPAGSGAALFAQVAALRLHRIDAEAELAKLGASSKLNADWRALQRLHRIGRTAAEGWLERNVAHLGRRSTMALDAYA
jgi:NTE family protein